MRRIFKSFLVAILVIFLLPALASLAVWEFDDTRPASWRQADWSSAGLLPPPQEVGDAVIHVMAARTGRWKGAFSVHSWIVVKESDIATYERYEVVGWGRPIRRNAYAPDARWYSNQPEILLTVRGEDASRLIPKIREAIADYPHGDQGDYVIWPGPNSNSFVARVLDAVPELGQVLPANSVGRDYLGADRWIIADPDGWNLQVSLAGYAGFAIGRRSGFEVNLLGLVAGFDIARPAIKLPGFGTIPLG